MTEENAESVIEETPVSAPEASSPEVQVAEEIPTPAPKTQEYNWAEARRAREAAERDRDSLARRVREQEELIQRMAPKPPAPEPDELDRLGDDDIVTKKQAKALASRMAREAAQEAVKAYTASTVEERIRSRYSDFNEVVNPDNIELLKQRSPALARSISYASDPFDQASAAYEAIKSIIPEGNGVDMAREKERAQKNVKKPVNSSSISTSPIGRARSFENGLTPELAADLRKEMADAIKRY